QFCTKVLCKTPRWNATHLNATTYLIERDKKNLERTWFGNQRPSPTEYYVHSNYKEKYLRKIFKGGESVTEYKPGINLVTFKALNGIYPGREIVTQALLSLAGIAHGD